MQSTAPLTQTPETFNSQADTDWDSLMPHEQTAVCRALGPVDSGDDLMPHERASVRATLAEELAYTLTA